MTGWLAFPPPAGDAPEDAAVAAVPPGANASNAPTSSCCEPSAPWTRVMHCAAEAHGAANVRAAWKP